MAPLSVWSQFSPVATCGKKKNKKKPSPQKAHRASLQKRHLWKGWHETSYNKKVWLWLFLFWVFDPQRFNICKSFLKPRESNLNRWQCKANGPRRKLWAGPAGETLLSIFSGLLHNQDSPLWQHELHRHRSHRSSGCKAHQFTCWVEWWSGFLHH